MAGWKNCLAAPEGKRAVGGHVAVSQLGWPAEPGGGRAGAGAAGCEDFEKLASGTSSAYFHAYHLEDERFLYFPGAAAWLGGLAILGSAGNAAKGCAALGLSALYGFGAAGNGKKGVRERGKNIFGGR